MTPWPDRNEPEKSSANLAQAEESVPGWLSLRGTPRQVLRRLQSGDPLHLHRLVRSYMDEYTLLLDSEVVHDEVCVAIAESAGLITVPHTSAGTPWGQHFAISMPESPIAEYWMGSDPGIPLDEVCPIPGMPMPKDGYVVPSDAPGFGMEIKPEWINPWDHTAAARARGIA